MLDNISESCYYLLYNFPEAECVREYIDNRITKNVQNKFKIGYFPNNDNLSALTNLVDKEVLINEKLLYEYNFEDNNGINLGYRNYFEDYPLVIPFKDQYGKVIALVGRTLIPENERKISKYKNSHFKKRNYLFGLYENKEEIIKKDHVFVVEGQFDVIKAYEKGLTNTVALGNTSMTIYQFLVILRYTNNIVLLLDNDEAGEKGREKIMHKFGKYANIQNFYLPLAYKDIDEFFNHHTLEDFSLL